MADPRPLLPAVAAEEKAPRPFLPLETLFAWLLPVFGYLFWLLFPMSEKPFGAALLIAALYGFTFPVLLRGRCRFDLSAKLVFFSAALALLAVLLWADEFHRFLCFCYLLAAYAYLVLAGTGNTLERCWSELVGSDLLRAWFVYPFSSFCALFRALLPRRGQGAWRVAGKLALGLVLAVIPTWTVFSLLSFDSGFTALTKRLFSFSIGDVGEILARFCFGIPVAMYVFGLYYSSVTGAPRKDGDAQRIRARAERRRVLPLLSACASVLPLLFVYVVFFISQWDYYTAAFTGVLPAHLSYAQYAREGFFQLCAVACLNFLVLLALSRYVRRRHERVVRALCVTLALFTLVLIVTALSKLWLYVAQYGLTPDRVHAAWFMLLLSLLFVLVMIKQFSPQFKALPLALALTVALFLLLALSGSNRWIARYDVERCLSGQTEQADVYMLCSLGDDAVPELLRLYAQTEASGLHGDCAQTEYLRQALESRAARNDALWERSLSSLRAERLLREAGFAPPSGE